jgi:hypothetical protein
MSKPNSEIIVDQAKLHKFTEKSRKIEFWRVVDGESLALFIGTEAEKPIHLVALFPIASRPLMIHQNFCEGSFAVPSSDHIFFLVSVVLSFVAVIVVVVVFIFFVL